MKRRGIIALCLSALLLFTGCAGELTDVISLNSEYTLPPPAGLQPLPERAGLENSVAAPEPARIVETGNVSFVSNELVLVLGSGLDRSRAAAIAARYGYTVAGFIEAACAAQLRADKGLSLAEAEALCEELEREPGVRCASPLYIRKTVPQVLPEDDWQGDALETETAAGCNWGMEAIGAAWLWENYPDIPSVRVGVLDTMFDVNHEDVRFAQLLHGDIYYSTDKAAPEASHGTSVAGILAATHGNHKGGAGVLGNCELVGSSLYGAQERGSCLTELSLLAELFSYGIEIVNYSMGYEPAFSAAVSGGEETAVRAFESETRVCAAALENVLSAGYDFLLVCAAGNTGADARYASVFNGIEQSAVSERILVVGAAELTGPESYALASYSGTGARVDVVAPGSGIYTCADRNGYTLMNGTSAAAPHAAGACAVIRAMYPELSCDVVRQWVIECADIRVGGTEKCMIDLMSGVDPYYNGKGEAPEYTYSSSDPVDFFLFLCAENEKLDAGSTQYYFHRITGITTLEALLRSGVTPDAYYAFVPLDGLGTPLRTDVVQILDHEEMGVRKVCRVKYRVLCSGDMVYDKVSEVRESVLSLDTWVWTLREEVKDFGSDTIWWDEDHNGTFETPVRVVDLRTYFHEHGSGSVRLVGSFTTAALYPNGVQSWEYSNPVLMTVLGRIKAARGNAAFEIWTEY